MSNLSQFIGGIAGARVGDIVEIYSNEQIITEGGKTYLKGGNEIATSDYPNFPKNKINKLNFTRRANPRNKTNTTAEVAIDTDGDGVWVLFSDTDQSIWRSEDNGVTWTCVFVFGSFFTDATFTQSPMFPVLSNNFIGTWVLSFNHSNFAYSGMIFSEDNGKTWQYLSHIAVDNITNIVIRPYSRDLVGLRGTGSYIAYSSNFGRSWTATGTPPSTNIPERSGKPVFSPDGSQYIVPVILGWETSSIYMGFIRYTGTTFLDSTQGPNGTLFNNAGESSPPSIAFNSDGYLFLSSQNFVRKNKIQYNYSLVSTNLEDISASLTTATAFLSTPKSKVVYAVDYASTLLGNSFKVSTDNGVSWSAIRNHQPGKYPLPILSSAAMGKDNKIIGSKTGYQTGYSYTPYTNLGEIYVLANAVSSLNVSNLFPATNKLQKVNNSSFIAYSSRENTLYRGVLSNNAMLPIFEPGNTRIFAMASNETLSNVVISDATAGQIRFSIGNGFANGTMNTSWNSSPAANIFIDSRQIKQNNAETGFSYIARESTIYYLGFSSDGTKMYTMGTQRGNLDQYVLSTAWNPSTASYDNKFLDIKAREATPYAGFFKPDGTQFYAVGISENVHQYTLSTAWDVSTATYNVHCNINSAIGPSPTGITFSPNGTFMYINSTGDDRIVRFKLNEAWNIASTNGAFIQARSTQLNGTINDGTSITFSPDGRRLYYATNRRLYEMGMTIPYDITTIIPTTATNYRETPFQFNETTSIVAFIKPDGKRLYVSGHAHDNVYSYEVDTSSNTPPIATTDRIADICYSNGVFLAVSIDGVVIKSVDNGLTWERRFVTDLHSPSSYDNRYLGTDYTKKINMSSNGTAILASEYEVYRSTDYGNNFTLIQNTQGYKIPTRVTTDDNGTWVISDYNGDIFTSTNDGVTWSGGFKGNPLPTKIGIGGASILSTNLATLDFAITSSNCACLVFGSTRIGDPNTFVYITKNDGSYWQQLVIDTNANSTSRCLFVGNTLVQTSYLLGQGGVRTVTDSIGLLSYNSNEYLRVE